MNVTDEIVMPFVFEDANGTLTVSTKKNPFGQYPAVLEWTGLKSNMTFPNIDAAQLFLADEDELECAINQMCFGDDGE